MENFDAHKWFKKQYLEEANIEEQSDLVPRMESMVDRETYKRFLIFQEVMNFYHLLQKQITCCTLDNIIKSVIII